MKGLREDEKRPEPAPPVVEQKVDEPRPAQRPETPGSATP